MSGDHDDGDDDAADDLPGALVTTDTSSVVTTLVPVESDALLDLDVSNGGVTIYEETRRTVKDMTAEHATATKEVARFRYAVPEEQRTARSMEQTTRQKITGGVVVIGLVMAALVPASAVSMAIMVGVLGGGLVFGEYFNREKRKPDSNELAGK